MKKKILSLLLVLAMLLSLAACAKKEPTAEELLEGIRKVDASKFQDLDLSVSMTTEQDGQAMDFTMKSGVAMRGDVVHIYDMSVDVGMSGLSITVKAEGWLDSANKVSYMNMSALGQESGWTKSAMDDSEMNFDVKNMLDKFSKDEVMRNLTLQEHEGGEQYVVTWEFDVDALADIMSTLPAECDSTRVDSVTAAAWFDEATHDLVTLQVGTGVSDDDGMVDINVMFMFKTWNGDEKLAIPSEVVETAVEDSDSSDPFGFDSMMEDDEPEPQLPDYEPDDSFGGYDDDAGYDYSGDGGPVTNDGEGYDEVIDPLAEQVALNDPNHKGIWVYHYGGMTSMNYSTGGLDWIGDVMVEHMDPETWGSAEDAFKEQADWLRTWYGGDPVTGSVEEKSVTFAKLDEGNYEIDLAAWNGDMYISADIYTYGGMSAEDAVGHLNEMLAMAGVN